MTVSYQSPDKVSRFVVFCFACNYPPSCFCHAVRRCESSLRIVKNMSARERKYNAQEALEKIWNNSGDEEDFNSDESKVEWYESANEDESDESVDDSASNEENAAQDSEESSDDEASDDGDGVEDVRRVNRGRQRLARQQQAPLVWRMAHGTTPRDIAFTGNSGIQVQTVGFEPHNYFALFINNDLLNCFVAEANRYADEFIAEGNLRRRSRANDWSPTDRKEMKQFMGLFFFYGDYSQTCYTHVLVHGPLVLYPHFQCYHEQKSFPVASEIFTFQ